MSNKACVNYETCEVRLCDKTGKCCMLTMKGGCTIYAPGAKAFTCYPCEELRKQMVFPTKAKE